MTTLHAQEQIIRTGGLTSDPTLVFERQLKAFQEAMNSPLTAQTAQAMLVGETIWQRLAGAHDFYLAPVISDLPAYQTRIRTFDSKADGISKSKFSMARLPLSEESRQALTTMNIVVPEYYQKSHLIVLLPGLDIDRLNALNFPVEILSDYGRESEVTDAPGGEKSVIWSEGWEGSTAAYTFSGGATRWGKVSCQPYAGTWSMWCAGGGTLPQPQCTNYLNSMNTSVHKTTGVDVSSYVNVYQTYRYKHQTETNYDFFNTYYSNNGSDWTLHLSRHGNSTGYPAYVEYFNQFVNFSTLFYKFEFTSDISNSAFAGVFIDNLEITGDPGCTSYTQYPSTTLVPEDHWKRQLGIFAGEFAKFSLTAGTEYQWSLCTDHCGSASYNSELTIRRADNDQILAYADDICGDDARISWNSNYTGDVKAVVTQYPCQSLSSSSTLAYKSGGLLDPALSVIPTSRSIAYNATTTTFDITSNATWSISGWPAWVTSVSPSSGNGNQTITITCEPNNMGGPQRIATMSVSSPCLSPITFTLTQATDPGCTSTSQYGPLYAPTENWKYLTSIYAGQYALFSVTSGTQYQWSLCSEQGGDASYDSQLTLRKSDDTYITYSNNICGDDARISWTATFTGTVKVIVSQNNCQSNLVYTRLGYKNGSLINPAISVIPNSRFVDAFEGSTTFNITSNTSWTLSGWPSWMTVSQASGSGNATITVVYGLNSGNAGRTGTITLSAPGVANAVFTLNQGYKCNSTSQYPSSTLTPASYWKYQGSIYAGEYSLHSVVYGVTYHWSLCPTHGGNAPSYEPELTLRNAATDELLAYANLNCSNPIYNGATISWTATYTGQVKVIVTQYQCNTNTIATCLAYKSGNLTDAALAVSPAVQSVGYLPGWTTFTLTSNGAWTISGWPAWITSVSPASGIGNATITVNYSANNTGGPTRQGTLTASQGCLISEQFSVLQGGDPGCVVASLYGVRTMTGSWQYINNLWAGEYVQYPVVSGTIYNWSLCPEHCGNAPYDAELSLRKVSDNSLLAYSDDGCGDDGMITWTADFTGDVKLGVTKYHCQSESTTTRLAYKSGAFEAPSISVTPTNRLVSSNAGSVTFNIATNSTWSLSGIPAWVTSITPATSGSGNSTITVNYAANTTSAQRQATLSANLPCGSSSFAVIQGEPATACPSYDFALLPLRAWQTHSSSHGTYSGKMYRFPVVSGMTYSFKTGCGDGATANYDTYLLLYDLSCNLLLTNDDGCAALLSKIDWTADYTGYVYLKVQGLASAWGNYTLAYRFEGCQNSVMYTGPHDITNNWNWVTSIFAGEHSTFNVTQGVQYHWSLCPEHCGSTSYDSELTLRKQDDGSFLAYGDDECGDDARISWTATFTGQVRVMLTMYPCTAASIGSTLAFKSGNLDAPALAVSPSSVNYFPSYANSTTYGITSNVPWTISGWPSWITSVSPASGTGNAVVTVTYAANTTGVQREATLNFTPGCGITLTRTIIQGETPTVCPSYDYTLYPGIYWVLNSGSHGTYSSKLYRVFVNSNSKYTFKTGCGDGATANYDTELRLYDASCNLVGWAYDGCENSNTELVWTSGYTGEAYLKVSGFGGYSYGNYTLAYRRCDLPAQPATISGNINPCQGTGNTYSVSAVSGATSYIWTLPAGWSGSSTSNAIVATAGAVGGAIKVKAINDCGEGTERTLVVSVMAIPAQPGVIAGPSSVFNGGSYTYSVAAVSGASVYSWTLPAGWSGSSITNSITAIAGAGSGLITVTAGNVCGTSPGRSRTVTSSTLPVTQTLQNTMINAGQSVCFSALQTITLAGSGTHFTVMNTGSVELVAGQNILMYPGTSVNSGGYMLARIANAYNYCTLGAAKELAEFSTSQSTEVYNVNTIFNLYPNPSNGVFTVEQKSTGNVGDMRVDIFTLRGEQVYRSVLPDQKKHEFRLDHLVNGMYILKIQKGDHFQTFKLVIAR
jgi:hypothetical protein